MSVEQSNGEMRRYDAIVLYSYLNAIKPCAKRRNATRPTVIKSSSELADDDGNDEQDQNRDYSDCDYSIGSHPRRLSATGR